MYENRASDEDMRQRHNADVRICNGECVYYTAWREAPRGEKLRRWRENRGYVLDI